MNILCKKQSLVKRKNKNILASLIILNLRFPLKRLTYCMILKNKRFGILLCIFTSGFMMLCLILFPRSAKVDSAALPPALPLIVNHNAINDFEKIPPRWIESAKKMSFHYAHTSHGSQLTRGLLTFESQNPNFSISIRENSVEGLPPEEALPTLKMYDGNPPETYIEPNDYWDGESALTRTRAVATTGHYNFSLWSWCGQQSTNSQATVMRYLENLNILEEEFPNMRFIYMTGHTDGSNTPDTPNTLKYNNNLVRDYALAKNKVLFDFADIESYDPDGNYYPNTTDACGWCSQWCQNNPADCIILDSTCSTGAHTHPYNCKLKAKAFWWMMARLSGWNGEPELPTNSELMGHWEFENNLNDISGNENHGIGRGNLTWFDGKNNKALLFDGKSYVDIEDREIMDNTDKLTIAFWVYPAVLDGNDRGLISKRMGPSAKQSYSIFFGNDQKLYVDIDQSNDRFSSAQKFEANKWYHVTLVYNGSLEENKRAKLYINGRLDREMKETSIRIPNYNSNLYLGTLNAGYQTSFEGGLDDLRIIPQALTSEEMIELFEKNNDIPLISQINVSDVSSSGAKITWETDKRTNSQVEYGTSVNYGTLSYFEENLSNSHYINLTELAADTTYHFRVISNDREGNNSQSQDQTFTTLKKQDTTPPTGFVKIAGDKKFTNTPTIELVLSAGDTSGVKGMKISEESSIENVLEETFNIKKAWSLSMNDGLKKIYVWFQDEEGNWNIEPYWTTIFLDTIPPEIKNIKLENIAENDLQISWETNELTRSQIKYGFSLNFLKETSLDDIFAKDHNIKLQELSGEATYYYCIKAFDEAGNEALTADFEFTTMKGTTKDATPPSKGQPENMSSGGGGSFINYVSNTQTLPPKPLDFKIIQNKEKIMLSWINPKYGDFLKVRILRKENTPPISFNDHDARILYEGNKEEYVDMDLENNKAYFYTIFAFDRKLNHFEISTVVAKFLTEDKTIEIKNNSAENELPPTKVVKNLHGLSKEDAEFISSEEAKLIYEHSDFVNLNKITEAIYINLVSKNNNKLGDENKYSIAKFIHDGTETTSRLGAGERAGVIESYWEVFNKLPKTENEWEDVIKIANSRYPEELNREQEMKKFFQAIFNREPNLKNLHDEIAIAILTYGFRPTERNLFNEAAGIKSFKWIFKRNPKTALDWNIIRTIAYSGAQR